MTGTSATRPRQDREPFTVELFAPTMFERVFLFYKPSLDASA
jgi:hypothetical protein